jgi:pimeloyl-ACP methyl ester carboxylesterase
MVLWGSSDPRALLQYVPRASWVEIPDTGHHLELESPEIVAAALRRFLDART